MSEAGGRWEGPGVEAWEAWTPREASDRLSPSGASWCAVAGWAIDLALGTTTRDHSDLEITVTGPNLAIIRRHLKAYVWHSVGDGNVVRLEEDDEACPGHFQHWLLDPELTKWRLDVMLDPGDDGTWVYRRDPTLTASRSFMVGRTPYGIDYLRPHGSLLFKAKHLRPKDQADFDNCLLVMSRDERSWLTAALDRFHPGHVWSDALRKSLAV